MSAQNTLSIEGSNTNINVNLTYYNIKPLLFKRSGFYKLSSNTLHKSLALKLLCID